MYETPTPASGISAGASLLNIRFGAGIYDTPTPATGIAAPSGTKRILLLRANPQGGIPSRPKEQESLARLLRLIRMVKMGRSNFVTRWGN